MLAKVFAFNPQLAREGEGAQAAAAVRMNGRAAPFDGAVRIIVDDQFDGIEHRHPARRARLQIIAQRLFKYADIDPRVGFRYADAFTEQTDAGRREPAPAQTGERRQARVVPAINVLRLHQLMAGTTRATRLNSSH